MILLKVSYKMSDFCNSFYRLSLFIAKRTFRPDGKLLINRIVIAVISIIYISTTTVYVVVGFGANMKQAYSEELVIDEFLRADNAMSVVKEADRIATIKGFTESVSFLDDKLAATDDGFTRCILLMEKSTLFINYKEYRLALKYALEATANDNNDTAYSLVAQIYEKLGEYNKAVEFYEKAIYFVDVRKSHSSVEIEFYNNRINYIENEL